MISIFIKILVYDSEMGKDLVNRLFWGELNKVDYFFYDNNNNNNDNDNDNDNNTNTTTNNNNNNNNVLFNSYWSLYWILNS